jgi:pyruvate/2-oxoglutarate dehydrogenase complex dihydrolipoamide acyltransferase (E2) component
MAIEIVVPWWMSETIAEVTLIQWFKKKGDQVQKGELLFELDMDIAKWDVQASTDGTLTQIFSPDNSVVTPQQVVGLLVPAGEAVEAPHNFSHLHRLY